MELECSFPPSDPAAVSSASFHVVEWVRQGLDIPVLIKFGSYAPRVHPQYEGELPSLLYTVQLLIIMFNTLLPFTVIGINTCHIAEAACSSSALYVHHN